MCGDHHRTDVAVGVAQTSHRARERDSSLRASQAERDRTVEDLRVHAGEGRLDVEELEARLDAALAAKTRGDLRDVVKDLPRTRRSSPRARQPLGFAAGSLVQLLIGIAIIAAAPAALAWVGWTLVGFWVFSGGPHRVGHRRRRSAPLAG
jgi:hypothetical protein